MMVKMKKGCGMQEYTTIDKKKLIDSFTNTTITSLRTFGVFEDSLDNREAIRELTLSMQEFNVLFMVLEHLIGGRLFLVIFVSQLH